MFASARKGFFEAPRLNTTLILLRINPLDPQQSFSCIVSDYF